MKYDGLIGIKKNIEYDIIALINNSRAADMNYLKNSKDVLMQAGILHVFLQKSVRNFP